MEPNGEPFCGSPAFTSRGVRRKPDDMVETGSPHSTPPATPPATPRSPVSPRPPAGSVKAHRFAAGRAMALLQAARTGSNPVKNKKSMSLDGAIPTREEPSYPCLSEGFQDPLCASSRRARSQRPRAKMSDDSESLSTRCGSPSSPSLSPELERPWPSHELNRKPMTSAKLKLLDLGDGCRPLRANLNEATEKLSWRAPDHVPIDCVIRRRKKRTKEMRLTLPFTVPKDDPRHRHLSETEGQSCQVQSQSSFAWVWA